MYATQERCLATLISHRKIWIPIIWIDPSIAVNFAASCFSSLDVETLRFASGALDTLPLSGGPLGVLNEMGVLTGVSMLSMTFKSLVNQTDRLSMRFLFPHLQKQTLWL